MALSAICCGLRGTCGLLSCVPPDPVTAQVMKTSRFMASGMVVSPSLRRAYRAGSIAKFAVTNKNHAEMDKISTSADADRVSAVRQVFQPVPCQLHRASARRQHGWTE